MASNRQQFSRAMSKWEGLASDGHFSVPQELGRTAIISSPFTDEEPGTVAGMTELTAFRSEAIDLADRVRNAGGDPEVAIDATHHDITRLIQDPHIVNMYAIGNGSLSALLLDVDDRYDWSEASAATNHIKHGIFVQRQCGGLTRNLNVPLGLFTIDNPRNVFAAVGVEFYPHSLDDAENQKIQPVFDVDSVDYSTIKDLHPLTTQAIDIAELKTLARSQPKIESDVRDAEVEPHIPPRHSRYNNFFRRFIEIEAINNGHATESQITYIRMIKERFGLDLLRFYTEESRLCNAICESIHAKEPYDRLAAGVARLSEMETKGEIPVGSTTEIEDATLHPLGIEAIGAFYWSQINPLLQEAYLLIEARTLNAPFLIK